LDEDHRRELLHNRRGHTTFATGEQDADIHADFLVEGALGPPT
jgi:hypothetical protein